MVFMEDKFPERKRTGKQKDALHAALGVAGLAIICAIEALIKGAYEVPLRVRSNRCVLRDSAVKTGIAMRKGRLQCG